MPSHSKVSPEELDALFPQYEVTPALMSRVETRIRNRCLLIAVFWTFRIFLAVYFPEFVLVTREQNPLLSSDGMEALLLIRIVLLALEYSFIYGHSLLIIILERLML